jgi:hypothetical protein
LEDALFRRKGLEVRKYGGAHWLPSYFGDPKSLKLLKYLVGFVKGEAFREALPEMCDAARKAQR